MREAGPDSLPDYELLELILFRAAPRRDTKPLAKALIPRFGTFVEALNAPEELLRERFPASAKPPSPSSSWCAGWRQANAGRSAGAAGALVLGTGARLLPRLDGLRQQEQFRILFLDKRNQIIADEVQQTGTVDHTPVYVREVKRALELSATAIVLVHNHPSGHPTPSRADVEMTKEIVAAAKPLGVLVHDHLIVGKQGQASFRGLGLI